MSEQNSTRIHLALLLLVLFLCGSTAVAVAQDEAWMFDRQGVLCCEDMKARLDNFIVQLQNQPEAMGYIVYYGGRNWKTCGSKLVRLPRKGEAQAIAARLQFYMLHNGFNFDPKRLIVINGGYRESWEAELWIVPKGQPQPSPTPTVSSDSIKFRGSVRRVSGYYCLGP